MLEFHGVSTFNRALLIDWVLQVFMAFNKGNSPSGFFTAVGLIDNYLAAKFKSKQSVGVDKLFLIGIASVLITAKFEEIKPIKTMVLLEKAGHGKFTHDQMLEMERDILQAVSFRIHSPVSLVNESMTVFIGALQKNGDYYSININKDKYHIGTPVTASSSDGDAPNPSIEDKEEMICMQKTGEDFCVYLCQLI